MALTANQARIISQATRTANLESIYTIIEDAAKEGNSSVLIDEALNYDEKAALVTNGFNVSNPSVTTTMVSWATVTV